MRTPTLTVRGEGRVEGPPERATVAATVQASGRSAALAAAALAEAVHRLDAARPDLVYAGVHTDAVQIHPVFDPRRTTVVTGYVGRSTTRLVLADFDRLSDVVVALAAVPDTAVDGPWWSLSATSPLHRQARVAAVHDAYARARDYAAAVGGRLGELVELSDVHGGGFGGPVRHLAMRAVAADTTPSFDFTPEPETVTAEVTARFRLVDPASPELPAP